MENDRDIKFDIVIGHHERSNSAFSRKISEICHGQVHVPRKERKEKENNNNNKKKKRSKNNKSSLGTPVSSTNETDHHNITSIVKHQGSVVELVIKLII
jgi:hypothetical protein